jgi:hypothetical protein
MRYYTKIIYFILSAFSFSQIIFLAYKLAPINEEEWVGKRRRFIVDIKDKEIILNSYGSKKELREEKITIKNAEIKKKIFSLGEGRNIEIIKRPLPPKLSLKIGEKEIDLLGWGHVGPISCLLFHISGVLRDISGFAGDEFYILGLRMTNIILILIFALVFSEGNPKKLFFFFPFQINFILIPASMLYYFVMSALTFLAYRFLKRENFALFHLTCSILIGLHMRGFIISSALFALSAYLILLEQKDKKERERLLSMFFKWLIIFLPLYALFSFIYIVPSLLKDNYEKKAFEGFEIFSSFIKEFLNKVVSLNIIQLAIMRLGDFFISANIPAILRELGIQLKNTKTPEIISFYVSTIFYVFPSFFSKDKTFFIFLAIYFILSLFAVPFFVGMPWQFIPLHFIILEKSFNTLESINSKIRGYLVDFVLLFLTISNSLLSFNIKNHLKSYLIYDEHKKVMKFIEAEKRYSQNILCITKSNIFYIKFDCDEAKFFILFDKTKTETPKIQNIKDNYDIVILSEHFFEISQYFQDFGIKWQSEAFLVLEKY